MIAEKSKPKTKSATPIATIQVPCHRFNIVTPSLVAGSGKPIRRASSWVALEQAVKTKNEEIKSSERIFRLKLISPDGDFDCIYSNIRALKPL